MRLRSLYISFLFFAMAYYSYSQNPYIEHFTTTQGLPSNTVYQVYQDSKKFIWFATDAGIVKYDGRDFVNYRKKDGLNNNEVVKVKEDAQGRLWLFYLNGTLNFVFRNRIVTNKEAPYLDSLRTMGFFHDFFQDTDKTVYFHYNFTRTILGLDSSNRIIKPKIIDAPPWIDSLTVHKSISRDSKGGLILWTTDGIFSLNKAINGIDKVLSPTKVYSFYHLANGTTYIQYLLFLERYRTIEQPIILQKYKYEQLVDSIRLPVISTHMVCGIVEDSRGYLWISTFEHGLFCLKDKKIVLHLPIRESQAIIEDDEKNIWVSSMKDGVYKIYPQFITHQHLDKKLFDNEGITALTKGPDGGIWCTNGSMVYFFKNNTLYPLPYKNPGSYYNQLYYLDNGKLIFGEKSLNYYVCENIKIDYLNKICRYTLPKTKRSPQAFKQIAISKDGKRISTFAQFYIIKMNPDTLFDKINIIRIEERIFNAFYNASDELVVNTITNFALKNNKLRPYKELSYLQGRNITNHQIIDSATEIYNAEGDSLLLRHRGKFYNLTAAFKFPVDLRIQNMIYEAPYLILASSQNIYSSRNFMNVIQGKKPTLYALDTRFKNINDILYHHDTLYVASDDGLSLLFRPFGKPGHTTAPVPYIQSIHINDSSIDLTDDLIKFRGQQKLSLHFSSINYSGQSVIFSYKMEGLDANWNEIQSKSVVYHHLPVGEYWFLLRARKFNSDWSAPIKIKVVVEPTFWQHPVFFAIAFVMLILTVVFFIIRRNHRKLIQSERAQQLISLEQKSLQAMMNPHFIFNSLGSIQSYLLQNKTSEAASYLSKFARLIRQNLSSVSSSTISLGDELSRLRNYLELERMRMENKFEFTFEIQHDIDKYEIMLPSMIIQPVIENAIWHGIAPLEGNGKIIARFTMAAEETLLVIVEDNGIGMKRAETYRTQRESNLNISMELNRKRLELIGRKYNSAAGISFEEKYPDAENPGTIVKIVLPVSHKHKGL